MDERKLYSFIVTIVCFALMVMLLLGVGIYTWITGGFEQQTGTDPESAAAIVETSDVSG